MQRYHDTKHCVYGTVEGRDSLHAQHKNLSITLNESQQRSISLMVTTSAAGHLVSVIAVLKDNLFSSESGPQLVEVGGGRGRMA